MFNVQWVSQVKILNPKPCVLLFRRNLVRPRASESESYQGILQEESHTIDLLLSIQIDKYEINIEKKCQHCFDRIYPSEILTFLINIEQKSQKMFSSSSNLEIQYWRYKNWALRPQYSGDTNGGHENNTVGLEFQKQWRQFWSVFKWLGLRISDSIQNPDHLQTNLFRPVKIRTLEFSDSPSPD